MDAKSLSRQRILEAGGAASAPAQGGPARSGRRRVERAVGSYSQRQTALPGRQVPRFADPLATFVGPGLDSSSAASVEREFQRSAVSTSARTSLC